MPSSSWETDESIQLLESWLQKEQKSKANNNFPVLLTHFLLGDFICRCNSKIAFLNVCRLSWDFQFFLRVSLTKNLFVSCIVARIYRIKASRELCWLIDMPSYFGSWGIDHCQARCKKLSPFTHCNNGNWSKRSKDFSSFLVTPQEKPQLYRAKTLPNTTFRFPPANHDIFLSAALQCIQWVLFCQTTHFPRH